MILQAHIYKVLCTSSLFSDYTIPLQNHPHAEKHEQKISKMISYTAQDNGKRAKLGNIRENTAMFPQHFPGPVDRQTGDIQSTMAILERLTPYYLIQDTIFLILLQKEKKSKQEHTLVPFVVVALSIPRAGIATKSWFVVEDRR